MTLSTVVHRKRIKPLSTLQFKINDKIITKKYWPLSCHWPAIKKSHVRISKLSDKIISVASSSKTILRTCLEGDGAIRRSRGRSGTRTEASRRDARAATSRPPIAGRSSRCLFFEFVFVYSFVFGLVSME